VSSINSQEFRKSHLSLKEVENADNKFLIKILIDNPVGEYEEITCQYR